MCTDVSKHGRRDQGSPWPLTLAPSGTPRRPTKGFWGRGSCWMWVVSSRDSVPLWQVQFLIGSGASWRPESSRHCPVWFERPGTERTGQDGSDCPQRSAAFQMPSIPPLHSTCRSNARFCVWQNTKNIPCPHTRPDFALEYCA